MIDHSFESIHTFHYSLSLLFFSGLKPSLLKEIMEQNDKSFSTNNPNISREEFDATKIGVKGLVDSGVVKIPSFFVFPPEILQKGSRSSSSSNTTLEVPLIDLSGYEGGDRRREIVNDLRIAAETWGIFQLVNHGMSKRVMEDLMKGIRLFHEQKNEEKMKWFSKDHLTNGWYYVSGHSHQSSTAANWRDTLAFNSLDGQFDPDGVPQISRREVSEYMKSIKELKEKLSELVSEALGLKRDYLSNLKCLTSETFRFHYYPVCPEPEKTLGLTNHSDPYFLTILLQDSIGGLQVFHQNQWVDVPHIDDALIVNIGDMMQIMTNAKFKSVEHRVLAGNVGPRMSAVCFFYPSRSTFEKPYGPLEELISESQAPLYREVCFREYISFYRSKRLNALSAIPHFKL